MGLEDAVKVIFKKLFLSTTAIALGCSLGCSSESYRRAYFGPLTIWNMAEEPSSLEEIKNSLLIVYSNVPLGKENNYGLEFDMIKEIAEIAKKNRIKLYALSNSMAEEFFKNNNLGYHECPPGSLQLYPKIFINEGWAHLIREGSGMEEMLDPDCNVITVEELSKLLESKSLYF